MSFAKIKYLTFGRKTTIISVKGDTFYHQDGGFILQQEAMSFNFVKDCTKELH